MYGLPPDFDANRFVGRRVEQVSFTMNTIHVSFEGDLSVTILGVFEHGQKGDDHQMAESVPVASSALMQLVGKAIVQAGTDAGSELLLIFQDGQWLKVIDDSPQYESFMITDRGRRTIV